MMPVQSLVFIIVVLWLVLLTAFSFGVYFFIRRFSNNVDKGNIVKLIDNIILKERSNAAKIVNIQKTLKQMDNESRFNLQKVGLVKFNPYNEMGGDHSFSIVLLDKDLDGFAITALHARERTRVYVKDIMKGKSKYELSKEELRALKKAMQSKD